MVKNAKILRQFEQNLVRSTKPNYRRNVKLINALLRYARKIGTFPPKDLMDGIDIDIKYAKVINSVR